MDLASILTIIGYFVPVIFEKLVDLIKNQGDGDPDLLAALKKLRIHMSSACTLIPLIRADTNDGLFKLLKELKEETYEADDLLDELNYLLLKEQVEEGDNVDNHSSHSKQKKASPFSHNLKNIRKSIFSNKKQKCNSEISSSYLFRGDDKSNTVDRINKIAENLEFITSEVRKNVKLLKREELAQNRIESSPSYHRVTTSVLPFEQNVLGREKERDEIIELLLNPPVSVTAASSKNMIFVLPIVGIGGVGKTTLAQLIYNNERVKREFNVRIWMYVSKHFDVFRLTRQMLEALGVSKLDLPTNMDSLQVLLKEKLRSKRFLLVLDDVWSPERSNWEKLCAPLGSEQPGCQILITTRLVTDVSIVNNEIHTMSPIKLKGLPKEEYWSLFEKCAFRGEVVGDHPKLEEIGRKIVKKLSGSPLAAKTVGGLLRVKLNIDHWQSILESDIWKLKQDTDDIMPALRLSYQHLPLHLQQCFAYCSLVPKGYRFKVDRVVVMWIAQGYVQNETRNGKKRLMDIGREYFCELERMYFFEAYNYNQWLVHDLLHDLAESVSADECFRVDGTKRLKEISSTVRHLFVDLDMIKMDALKSSCSLSNLRTLIIQGDFKDHMATLEDLFKELRRVRVLYLNKYYGQEEYVCSIKIGHMIHLRCIVAKHVSKLFHSCGKLYQLQFFKNDNFRKCATIGKLTCLQELKKFYVEKKGRHGIGQLKNLRELGGSLELFNLDNVASKTEALEAQLNQKEHILGLALRWNGSSSPKVAEEVLEGLQPPHFIKELTIRNYPGVKSPTWVSGLTFLTRLYIAGAALEDVELTLFLQDLMCLSSLRIERCPGVNSPTGLSRLTHLSSLDIERCPKITTLLLLDGLHRPKALTNLYISDCPELMTIVGLQELVSLVSLSVIGCPKLEDHTIEEASTLILQVRKLTIDDPALLTVLLKSTQSLHYLQCLRIKFCNLTYLNIEEIICSHLTSLKMLEIACCDNLESLQHAYLKSLPSLEELYLMICHKLQSLPPMPASLKTLSVLDCPSVPKGRYQEGGEDQLNIAHVNTITWP